MENTAVCNLELERWGSLFFQKGRYQGEETCKKGLKYDDNDSVQLNYSSCLLKFFLKSTMAN
jgi:hypothetical protein